MNTRRIGWLTGLLVLQLLVVAGLLMSRGQVRDSVAGPLLSFEPAAVDGIVIDEPDATSLRLERVDGRWQLPAGIPADAGKIDTLLQKLAGLSAPWPVATTASGRKRFEVADDQAQRTVRLSSGDRVVGELLLGTSPGFRRLHARVGGQDDVFEVDLSHFELATAADDWLDKAVLAANGDISAIVREGAWELERGEAGWQIDGVVADAAQAENLVARMANLRVLGLAPESEPAALPSPPATATFRVRDAAGEQVLRLFAAVPSMETAAGESAAPMEYVVESDRQAGRFRLAAFAADQLLVDAASLAQQPETTDAVDGAASGEVTEVPAASADGQSPAARTAD